MQAATFWKTVTMDRVDLLGTVLSSLSDAKVRFCVIGGQAVNASVDPVVSLDLDIALAAGQSERVEELFPAGIALAAVGGEDRCPLGRTIRDVVPAVREPRAPCSSAL